MAFDLEAAFNKFTSESKQEFAAARDEIKTSLRVKKTGAIPSGVVPHARRMAVGDGGVMNSKGFSFAKVMLHVSDPRRWKSEQWCPNEMAVMDGLTKSLTERGYKPESDGFGVAPIFPEQFDTDGLLSSKEINGFKAYVEGGSEGADPEEMGWLAQKYFGAKAAATPSPAQAAFADASLGGTLIGPPTWGPPLELLRNQEALMNAGATTMPIGPTGSILMPKLVAPTTATLVGENRAVTPSTYSTGQIELRAKKIMSLVVMPGELLRFGGPNVEQLTRADMMKSVALGMDYQLLFGAGSNISPLGLYTMAANTTTTNGGIYVAPTIGVPGSSGYGVVLIQPSGANQMSPQDIYDFEAGVEQNNGSITAYIMAPRMFTGFRKSRWTPYSGGTNQGGFVFDLTRQLDGTTERAIDGKRVVVSNQIPVTMTAWSGTGSLSGGTWTNIFGLDAARYIIALFGGIEFAQETGGIQLFGADQVAVRALASFDGAMSYPGLCAVFNPALPVQTTLGN